jgi:hypothetical protein
MMASVLKRPPSVCRFQSGFFFRHPLMLEYDYYWYVKHIAHTRLGLILKGECFNLGVWSPVWNFLVMSIMIRLPSCKKKT